MDQSAFRQLVSSQSSIGGGGGGGGGGGNAEHDRERKSKRVFGKSQKRSGTANISNKDEIQLVPRKLGKNATSTEQEEDEEEKNERARLKKLYAENYTDRAAARRSGQEELNEYNDVEKLKEDFAKRLESAKSESERQQLRQQMSFLGGDAKHTVLVNGLDFALLEQQRAKMNGDDDLENAFNSNSEKRKMEKVTYTNTTSQIKNNKFKPIGSSKPKEEESPEYIWRNGKRMRKKRKDKGTTTLKSDATEVTQSDVPTQSKRTKVSKKINKEEENPNTTTQQSEKEVVEENENSHSKEPAPSVEDMTPSKNIQTTIDHTQAPVEDSEEEDEDIFAGAGRWDGGFADEASDEDGTV